MTKPLIEDTRWAVTSGGTESTEVADLDGDVKDNGYPADATPDNKNWNWWHRKAHAWFQYLNSGVLDGDHSIAGDLTIGGQAITFTGFTFTLTDPDADGVLTMHAVGHGRETGDGPERVTNSGGALPAPLATGTDYWAIRIGPDDLILATSLENALLNKRIVFTTGGTGTQSVVSTGGTARVEDVTVTRNLHVGGRITQATRTVRVPLGAPASMTGPAIDEVQITGGTNGWRVTLPALADGETITAIRAQVRDSATGPTTVKARLYNSVYDPIPDGVGFTTLATTNTSAGDGTEQLLVATGLTVPVVATASYHIIVTFVAGSGTVKIHHIDFDVV